MKFSLQNFFIFFLLNGIAVRVWQIHCINRYDAIQYDAIQYNVIQYDAIQYDPVQYDAIQYDAIQYDAIQYDAIQYDAHTHTDHHKSFGRAKMQIFFELRI